MHYKTNKQIEGINDSDYDSIAIKDSLIVLKAISLRVRSNFVVSSLSTKMYTIYNVGSQYVTFYPPK